MKEKKNYNGKKKRGWIGHLTTSPLSLSSSFQSLIFFVLPCARFTKVVGRYYDHEQAK